MGPPGGGPSLAGGPSRDGRRTGCYPLPSAARAARQCDDPRPPTRSTVGGPSPDHGQARPRHHVPTRAAPAAPAPGRTARPADRRPAAAPRRAPRPDDADRRRRGARRRARGRDRRRGDAQAETRPPKRATQRGPSTRAPVRAGSTLAIAAAEEYAYVARDVRRIAIVGGALIAAPAGALGRRPGHRVQRPLTAPAAGGRRGRATIGPCHPPGGRPAPDPRPSSSHRPSGSRSPRGCARGTSTSSSARSTSSASAARSAAASPAATSRRCSCGDRPAPARPASRACSPAEIGAHFTSLSAVMSGVAEVRAHDRRGPGPARPSTARGRILFLDEIHRFNKAQQDALLPHVEDGTVTLDRRDDREPVLRGQLGAPVADARLAARGADRRGGRRPSSAGRSTTRSAAWPARSGPTAASASPTTRSSTSSRWPAATPGRRSTSSRARPRWPKPRTSATPTGRVSPRLEDVEAAAQQRVLAYDRAGDGHYDTVSAFIKSLRGNDPDAALYWLAAMIAAGEDPKFIARRLIISASEDVGNADPRALQVAVAAGQALDWIGLPEAQYALAQATTYIATAPKSNRSGAAYWAAVADVDGKRRRCRSRSTCATRRRPPDEAARDRRRLPVTRTTSRAPTSSSSTCPTSSSAGATTCRRPGLRGDHRGPDGGARRGAARRQASARSRGRPRRWPAMSDALTSRARRTARSWPRPQKTDAGGSD